MPSGIVYTHQVMYFACVTTTTWNIPSHGTAQMQLDTRTRVMGTKDAGKVGELIPKRRGCPS